MNLFPSQKKVVPKHSGKQKGLYSRKKIAVGSERLHSKSGINIEEQIGLLL
jgi:hypothetical protein